MEILIVEDTPTQARDLTLLLERDGYTVAVADNGQAALVALQQQRPQLIVSVATMPVMDGYELCRAVKASPELQDIPVILLTALTDPQEMINALQCGAD